MKKNNTTKIFLILMATGMIGILIMCSFYKEPKETTNTMPRCYEKCTQGHNCYSKCEIRG